MHGWATIGTRGSKSSQQVVIRAPLRQRILTLAAVAGSSASSKDGNGEAIRRGHRRSAIREGRILRASRRRRSQRSVREKPVQMRLRLCRSRRSRKLPVRRLGSPVARFARTVGAPAYQAAAYQLPLRDAARSSSYAEGPQSSLRAAGNPTRLADETHFHWRARPWTFASVPLAALRWVPCSNPVCLQPRASSLVIDLVVVSPLVRLISMHPY